MGNICNKLKICDKSHCNGFAYNASDYEAEYLVYGKL